MRSPGFAPRPAPPRSTDDQALFEAANRERAAEGLQPLQWNDALAAAAREHARVMARENILSHQCPGELPLTQRAARAGAKFSEIAENIGVGPTAESIHDGWMHSAGHRHNLLNPEVSAVGIATIRTAAGLFAVQDFSRPVVDLSLRQQEEKVIALLAKSGLRGARATDDARRTCRMNRGYAGPAALYLVRFEVSDLENLPKELLKTIQRGTYQAAAVGACRGGEEGGFTRYRIAVLLH